MRIDNLIMPAHFDVYPGEICRKQSFFDFF